MKDRCLLLYLCIMMLSCMPVFCACGQKYELILSDSSSESGGEGAEVESAESAAYETKAGAEQADCEPDFGAKYAGAESDNAEEAQPEQICVYICGAVQNAGVYTLPAGSRVYEAVEAAGGLTEDAEPRALNQAQLLADGQQITVYTKEEAGCAESMTADGSPRDSGAEASVTDPEKGKVNLNTAGKEELMTLNGIGETRAEAILAYREEHGGFSSAEELLQIDGIGEKTYGKFKDRITV